MRPIAGSTFVFLSSHAGPHLTSTDRRLLDVMAALLAEGAHVNLVCRPVAPIVDPARALGVTVAPYRLEQLNFIRTRSRMRKYLRRYDPPLAHSTGTIANLLLRLAAGPLPVKVVNSVPCAPGSDRPEAGLRGRGTRRLDARTLDRVDAFVIECPREPSDLAESGLDPRRVEVIVNGVDVKAVHEIAAAGCPRPVSNGTTFVAYCGEPHDTDALNDLLAAVAILREEGREVAAGILPTQAECRLTRRAEESGALRVVEAEDLAVLAGCADICCPIASRPGAPSGLFVGGALGKPTVLSAVPGVVGLLKPEIEALEVLPGDHEALATAIGTLMDDPERAARLGERARHRILDDYTAARTVERHLELYRRLISAV